MTPLCWVAAAALAQEPERVMVDVPLGLQRLVTERTGVPVNGETVPLTVEGVHDRPRVGPDGASRLLPVLYQVEVVVEPDATARELVDAALAAHNGHADAWRRYAAVEHDGVIDLVPTHIRTKRRWKRHHSPLDLEVTLPSPTGAPTELWYEVIAALRAEGVEIEPYWPNQAMHDLEDQPPPLTLPASAPARVMLARILAHAAVADHWSLMHALPDVVFDDGFAAWVLAFR